MQIRTFERDLKHLYANSHPSNEIRSIRMLLLSIRTRFEAFECIFEPFERDSIANSNANSNHLNQILSIRMHIRTHQKEFEAFEWKFKSFEPNSKHSYANPNLSNEIRNI